MNNISLINGTSKMLAPARVNKADSLTRVERLKINVLEIDKKGHSQFLKFN